jgi:glycosyltransferase involved in cell wall biosynthesis
MNISIIIPTYNSAKTIQTNIDSIKAQSFKDYQLIIIDNKSTDKTIEIIKNNNISNIKFLIEKDLGIFDAINKGIRLSDYDLISVLHSDDLYNDKEVLQNVVEAFNRDLTNEIIYGDLVYVKKDNLNSILRFWKPGVFTKGAFLKGWHPPHPSFFSKKLLFEKYGYYKLNNGNSADVELMYRFLEIYDIKSKYINRTLVKMRYGGASNKNIYSIIKQNLQILKFLDIRNDYLKICSFFLKKFLDRLKQFVIKK